MKEADWEGLPVMRDLEADRKRGQVSGKVKKCCLTPYVPLMWWCREKLAHTYQRGEIQLSRRGVI